MPKRILIVDDDRAICQLTSMWVKMAGYETELAHTGEAGVKAAKSNPPDVILQDVRLPDFDGFEVSRRIKDDPELADIPVIFLTASVQELARKQAIASGASGFLAKPFEAGTLLEAIKKALAEPLKKSA